MHALRRSNHRYLLECAVGALVLAGWSVVIFGRVGGRPLGLRVSDVGLAVVALGAGLACALTALRHQGRMRWVWMLMAWATTSWGIGQTIWTYYEVGLGHQVPFPSLADAGYLGEVPLAVAALLLLPTGTQSAAGRIRMVVDGLIIASSLLFVSWMMVLGTVFRTDTGTLFTKTISLAYPIGDVVLITIVLYAILRTRMGGRKVPTSLLLVGLGLVALSFADSGFTYLTAINAYRSGDPIDTGWFVGFGMILFAARSPEALRGEDQKPVHGQAKGLVLPYAAVMLSIVTSIYEIFQHHKVDIFASWLRSLIVTLLVLRQILTLRENVSLNRDLEGRMLELSSSQQRFEALVQQSSDVVTVVDADRVVRYQSESLQRVFGYPSGSLQGRPVTELVAPASEDVLLNALARASAEPGGVAEVQVAVRHSDGRVLEAEMTVTNLLDNPDVNGFVLNCRDISDQKTLERQLVHQAFHDPLTELANRALFREQVEEVLRGDRDERPRSAVLFLDLDGFKEINDSLGHATGDVLLTKVAERLRSCVRPGDTIARLGGDEFGVLVRDANRYVDPSGLAARMQSALSTPFEIDGREISISASIGIAMPDGADDASDQLLRNADLAMYRAKASGGSAVERYDPGMHAELVGRMQLESDLRQALGRGELVIYYQPVVSLGTCEAVGTEALLRWNHPERGLVAPGAFIPIAEQTGLIQPIGRWVLHEACRQTVIWRAQHACYRDLSLSVNVSARQLQSDDLIEDVTNALQENGLPPEALVLEMTESALFEHSDENMSQLGRLAAMGVRLAIDDFGTGYSSLAYLHRFSVDVLKVDRTFIDQLGNPDGDPELVRSILRIGDSLSMVTVAEGIERQAQLDVLRELGCQLGQGFLLARPMPTEQAASWLAEHRALLTAGAAGA